MKCILAPLNRSLERLVNVAYGPPAEGSEPAPLRDKLLVVVLFGILVAVGIGSCQLRQREAQLERERQRQAEQELSESPVSQP
jgi:hypothetical protein